MYPTVKREDNQIALLRLTTSRELQRTVRCRPSMPRKKQVETVVVLVANLISEPTYIHPRLEGGANTLTDVAVGTNK